LVYIYIYIYIYLAACSNRDLKTYFLIIVPDVIFDRHTQTHAHRQTDTRAHRRNEMLTSTKVEYTL